MKEVRSVGSCVLLEQTAVGEIVLSHRCEVEVTYFKFGLEETALNLRVFGTY